MIEPTSFQGGKTNIYLVDTISGRLKAFPLKEREHIDSQYRQHEITQFEFNRLTYTDFVVILDKQSGTDTDGFRHWEKARIAGKDLQKRLRELKISDVQIVDQTSDDAGRHHHAKCLCWAFLEGLQLSAYQFTKYQTKPKTEPLKINLVSKHVVPSQLKILNGYCEAVYFCKDLINEPHNFQSAVQFAKTIENQALKLGVDVQILDKKQIEEKRMGGLLGVNQGSENPPRFIILDWNPKRSKVTSDIVLVGKGLVFDTGGMNLKTGEFMSDMKSDMAGGAVVAATIFGLAATNYSKRIVGLIPVTDNRPGANALVPGDVIKMRSGKTVEIVNTDAEGRLILADALDFAKRYHPKLVIDVATLTGAASRALGKHGIVAMQKNADGTDFFYRPLSRHRSSYYPPPPNFIRVLKEIGEETYERIVEFPLWDEYAEELKSKVADLKNCGSAYGGAITAGKFLEEFIDYPYIHLDIAGVAFNSSPYKYYGSQASGFGVRLLLNFCEKIYRI